MHLAAAFPSWRTLTYTSDGIGTLALIYRLLVLASLLALWHTFVTSARDSRSASGANAETTVDDEARTGPVLAHSVVNPQDGTIVPGKEAEGD